MIKQPMRIPYDQTLFLPESVEPVYPFVTILTLGLLKPYRLKIKGDRVYLVDVGFNDVFVYDQQSARDRKKVFWKLNLEEAPELEVVSILQRHELGVQIEELPSFDPEFGQRGGWVKIDYQLRVQLEVMPERVGIVRHTTNPLITVRNAALRAARRTLPFIPYREALIATAEEEIKQRIIDDPNAQATGLRVTLVEVEGIESSKKLDEKLQGSFDRMLRAQDRRQIALQFASMDSNVFQQMLEAEEPAAALELRARAATQMVEAMQASGLNLLQAYVTTGQVVRDMGQPDSLAHQVAIQAFQQIKEDDWPKLEAPQTRSHDERLRWERQIALQRIPAQLQEADVRDDIFTFILENGDKVEIVWSARDTPPQVYINGQESRSRYITLSSGIYDYMKTTVWDLYCETRRLMGV